MGKNISVIGGDLRQIAVAEMLRQDGFHVKLLGFDKECVSDKNKISEKIQDIEKSDILIFPMPVTTDTESINTPFSRKKIYFSDLKDRIKRDALILGGRLTRNFCDTFSENKCIDYYAREELMIKNAVPTAEGAIEIAMQETPITLNKSRCLVVGYGKIGKVLSDSLYKLGADVTVSARKYSDLAWIEVRSLHGIHNNELEKAVDSFDIIFNTAPALILDESVLKRVSNECVIIDLASKPGGVDFEKARDLGLKVIWALSLPGKSAPVTSGKIIKDTIINILTEEGVV